MAFDCSVLTFKDVFSDNLLISTLQDFIYNLKQVQKKFKVIKCIKNSGANQFGFYNLYYICWTKKTFQHVNVLFSIFLICSFAEAKLHPILIQKQK